MSDNKSASLFSVENCVAGLAADSKQDIIAQLLDVLVASGSIPSAEKQTVLSQLLEREQKGSTGIGGGIAIPHVKTNQVSTIQVAVGTCPAGLDFEALDGQPVYIVLLAVSPAAATAAHVNFLSYVGRKFRDPGLLDALRNAETPRDIIILVDEN